MAKCPQVTAARYKTSVLAWLTSAVLYLKCGSTSKCKANRTTSWRSTWKSTRRTINGSRLSWTKKSWNRVISRAEQQFQRRKMQKLKLNSNNQRMKSSDSLSSTRKRRINVSKLKRRKIKWMKFCSKNKRLKIRGIKKRTWRWSCLMSRCFIWLIGVY